MGMMKNYFLTLLEQCSEENFGQDAIEWAVVTGRIRLSYELDRDVREIMPRYDEITEAYRRSLAQEVKEHRPPLAPMKRAAPRRRAKDSESDTSIRRKSAA
jgi:hypothetical protein